MKPQWLRFSPVKIFNVVKRVRLVIRIRQRAAGTGPLIITILDVDIVRGIAFIDTNINTVFSRKHDVY